MNPSPDQITHIQAFVSALPSKWNTTHADIRTAMETTKVANPVTVAPSIPTPFRATDLVNACSSANRAKLGAYLVGAATMIIAQDADHLAGGIDAMVPTGVISTDDATAMKAVLTRTMPDPSWTAQVAWDIGMLGRRCDDFDIETARTA